MKHKKMKIYKSKESQKINQKGKKLLPRFLALLRTIIQGGENLFMYMYINIYCKYLHSCIDFTLQKKKK